MSAAPDHMGELLSGDLLEGLADGAAAFEEGWRKGWEVVDPGLVSEWADNNRVLPFGPSAFPGQWVTDRNPIIREPMDCLSVSSPVQEITIVKPTQGGGSDTALNAVGYWIDRAPGPIMWATATGKLVKRFSKRRFDPMVELCEVLRAKVASPRSTDGSNTSDYKKFIGGDLTVASAESATDIASDAIRYVIGDEVDSWAIDLQGEGRTDKVLYKRTLTWGRRKKFVLISSPKKLKRVSIIWNAYLASDQRQAYVPCPKCGAYQVLIFEKITHTGEYLCDCGHAIPHSHKLDMLMAHEWRPKVPELSHIHRGYQFSALYTAPGLGLDWQKLYNERVAAGEDPAQVKVFLTTLLAEPYEPIEGKLEADDLKACREDWHMREIPRNVLCLTASVDVQKRYFSVTITGWGRGPQGWLIDVVDLPGSPIEPDSWDELEAYLDKPLINAYGIHMPLEMVAVDSGNWTDEVYTAVRERQHKRWFAIRGRSQTGHRLIGRPTYVDVTLRGKTLKRGLALYMLGTDAGKDTLLDRLALIPTQREEDRWFHLPADIPDYWFKQITAEQRDPETGEWVRVVKRNEAVDNLVYAWAAACHPLIRVDQFHNADWLKREEMYQPKTGDLFAQLPAPDPAEQSQAAPPPVAATPAPASLPPPKPRVADL